MVIVKIKGYHLWYQVDWRLLEWKAIQATNFQPNNFTFGRNQQSSHSQKTLEGLKSLSYSLLPKEAIILILQLRHVRVRTHTHTYMLSFVHTENKSTSFHITSFSLTLVCGMNNRYSDETCKLTFKYIGHLKFRVVPKLLKNKLAESYCIWVQPVFCRQRCLNASRSLRMYWNQTVLIQRIDLLTLAQAWDELLFVRSEYGRSSAILQSRDSQQSFVYWHFDSFSKALLIGNNTFVYVHWLCTLGWDMMDCVLLLVQRILFIWSF